MFQLLFAGQNSTASGVFIRSWMLVDHFSDNFYSSIATPKAITNDDFEVEQ
jgi:hypothetical protein